MWRTCGLKSEIGVWDLKSQLLTPCVTFAKFSNTLILQFPNRVTKRRMQRALWRLLIDHCLQSLSGCHWEKALNCMCLKDRCMLLHYHWNNAKYIVPKKLGERKRKTVADQLPKEELPLVRDVWSCSSSQRAHGEPFLRRGLMPRAPRIRHPHSSQGFIWEPPI